MIWTTTPWTLPANMAVAVSAQAEYGLYRFEVNGLSGMTIVATEMADRVFSRVGGSWESVGECTGQELEDAGLKYRHPFVERVCPIVTANYVTLEDGCGLVHTAPGHGVEDYQTGLSYGIDIYCPVQEDGTFDGTAPDWLRGKSVWEGNELVVDHLRDSGNLFLDEKFTHSYPHDWRSKTPVIFRATEQWFISVDRDMGEGAAMRGAALGVTAEDITFIPEWGRNRMRGMLDSRPDWCISRQRAWGLPIPAFFGPESGQVLLTEASVRTVADYVRQKGSDCWFFEGAEQILGDYDVAADADAPDWLKADPGLKGGLRLGPDIFDVWFESGASWHSVGRQRELGYPLDLYLEGSDQHRGWFQVSLLTALGATGQAPFKTVLTHGFMVDKDGKKMSKSGGNALNVDDLLKEYGADVCRWWVCGLNTDNDIKVDMEFIRMAGEEYRKVRNTLRFLLSNLNDFDPSSDRRELAEADANTVDAWAQGELAVFVDRVLGAYEGLRFREAHEAIYKFCNETLSAVYLTATKDRLYCDTVDSDRRRRTQTVLYDITDALIRLVAPVLVHTADEAWSALHGLDPSSDLSVHTLHLPERFESVADDAAWAKVMALRDRALKALEDTRAQSGLDNPLDAGIEATLAANDFAAVGAYEAELADLCGVSRFTVTEGEAEAISVTDLSEELRCERSWKRDGTVTERSDGGMLTDRDAAAVGV
jgi:isoleucyl-tRNA synthetase